jgi:hypothetical protein
MTPQGGNLRRHEKNERAGDVVFVCTGWLADVIRVSENLPKGMHER